MIYNITTGELLGKFKLEQVIYSNNLESSTFVKDVHVYRDMFYEVSLGIPKGVQDLISLDSLTFHNEEVRNLRVTESLKVIDFGQDVLKKILRKLKIIV